MPPPASGELGVRANDSGTNQGADQVAVALWHTCNQRIQAQLLECAQERFDGAVLAHPEDVKSVIEVDVLFALGKAADQFNPMGWKMREVGVVFFWDLPFLSR